MVMIAIYTYIYTYIYRPDKKKYIKPKIWRGVQYIVPLRDGDNLWIEILSFTFIDLSLVEKLY